ncbi:hypothetical protein TNCV_886151 [Trichonephila clavipes]|nr:hypothetical protein TNCV_886151 [Trichonephila clavipes]
MLSLSPYRVELFSNFHEGTQIAKTNTRFVYAVAFNWKRCRSRENVLRHYDFSLTTYKVFSIRARELKREFVAIENKNIYGDEYPTEKMECIRHVMKRMGTRLR